MKSTLRMYSVKEKKNSIKKSRVELIPIKLLEIKLSFEISLARRQLAQILSIFRTKACYKRQPIVNSVYLLLYEKKSTLFITI